MSRRLPRERVRYGLQRVRQAALVRIPGLPRRGWTRVGILDYPHATIRLKLDSPSEFHRLNSCAKEPWTVDWIERFVRPGDVLYDVGANVGAYSLVTAAATGGSARVVALEPGFANFAALCENVVLNGAGGCISPLPLALSEHTGLRGLEHRALEPGAADHTLGDAAARPGRSAYSQPVIAYALDDLISDFALPRPQHVKLDVDGAELEVLMGARRTLDGPELRSALVELEASAEKSIVGQLAGSGFGLQARFMRPGAGAGVPAYGLFTR